MKTKTWAVSLMAGMILLGISAESHANTVFFYNYTRLTPLTVAISIKPLSGPEIEVARVNLRPLTENFPVAFQGNTTGNTTYVARVFPLGGTQLLARVQRTLNSNSGFDVAVNLNSEPKVVIAPY